MRIESILQTERETLVYRLLALALVVGGLYLRQDTVNLAPALALALGYLIYLLSIPPLLRILRWPGLIYGMIAVDGLALTGSFLVAGDLSTPLVILPALLILYYSFFFGYVSSLAAATYFTLLYVSAAFLLGTAEQAGELIAVQVPLFYLLALLGGYLTRKRFQEQREKEDLQELLRLEARARDLVAAVREMRGVTEVGPVLQQVVRDAPRLTGLSAGLLALADRDTGELRAASAQSSFDVWSPERLREMSPSLVRDVVAQQALKSGQAIVVRERDEMPEWARKEGAGVLLALPLQVDARSIGVLYLWTSDAREIPQDGLERGRLYGVLAAAALASALTGQETQRQTQGLMSGLQEAIGRMERLREQRTDVTVGTLVVHGVRRQAILDGEALNLSPTEFDVLYVLAQNAEQPVNEETILRRVWGEAFTGQANVVDVCIHRLRRKMPREELAPRVVTVRGRGYMLTVPRERRATSAGSGEALR